MSDSAPNVRELTRLVHDLTHRLGQAEEALRTMIAGGGDREEAEDGRRSLREVRRTAQALDQGFRLLAAEREAVLDALPVLLALLSPEGTILSVNRTWRRVADSQGLDMPQHGVGANYLRVCSAADPTEAPEAPLVERGLREVLAGRRQSFTLDYPCHTPKRRRWFKLQASPLPDLQGAVVVHTGITHLKLAEEALVDSERRWRRLVTALPDALLIVSGSTVDLANPAAARLVGAERPGRLHLQGLGWVDLVHPEDQQRVEELLVEGPNPSPQTDVRMRRLDGSTVQTELRCVTTQVADRTAHLLIARDISERLQAQEELERLNRTLLHSQKLEAVGRLAGGIAHDFNNLLTAINGFSELLATKTEGNPDLHPFVAEIRRAGQRATDLTVQLLTFSRRRPGNPQVFDLHDKIRELVPMVRQLLGPRIHLNLQLEAVHPFIEADPVQVEQVVVNLVINARDAMAEGGDLTIGTTDDPRTDDNTGAVIVTVQDTGCGMNESVLNRIFEPFFTTKDEGSGLGLASAYGILEQSDGRIEVESEPGVGSLFRLAWPAAPARDEPTEPPMEETPRVPAAGATILLVEDEEPLCRLIRTIVSPRCRKLLVARNGVEALELAKDSGPIDLLLTDLSLPGTDGYQVAESLRQHHPDLAVVLMSGHHIPHRQTTEEDLRLIDKPFSTQELLTALDDALRARPDQ